MYRTMASDWYSRDCIELTTYLAQANNLKRRKSATNWIFEEEEEEEEEDDEEEEGEGEGGGGQGGEGGGGFKYSVTPPTNNEAEAKQA